MLSGLPDNYNGSSDNGNQSLIKPGFIVFHLGGITYKNIICLCNSRINSTSYIVTYEIVCVKPIGNACHKI